MVSQDFSHLLDFYHVTLKNNNRKCIYAQWTTLSNFTFIVSFNHYNNSRRYVLLLRKFADDEIETLLNWENLLKLMELARLRTDRSQEAMLVPTVLFCINKIKRFNKSCFRFEVKAEYNKAGREVICSNYILALKNVWRQSMVAV